MNDTVTRIINYIYVSDSILEIIEDKDIANQSKTVLCISKDGTIRAIRTYELQGVEYKCKGREISPDGSIETVFDTTGMYGKSIVRNPVTQETTSTSYYKWTAEGYIQLPDSDVVNMPSNLLFLDWKDVVGIDKYMCLLPPKSVAIKRQ